MDLPLYMRVLWRFKWLVIFGVIAAIALSVLAVARVDVKNGFKLSYRQSPEYSVQSTLFVTQQGFPWGYAAPDQTTQQDTSAQAKVLGGKQFADPSRFPSLAALYAYFAMSDPVKQIIRKSGKIDGTITAQPVISTVNGYGTSLPLVAIAATGKTPGEARALVLRATDAFQKFLDQQQIDNEIPSQNRVLVSVLTRSEKPILVKGRSKTLPLVVFVTVITSVLGLAFLLENVRPRVRPVRDEEAILLPTPGRQSA